MIIEVTQEDIDNNGHRCDCCPVYRALQQYGAPRHFTVLPYAFALNHRFYFSYEKLKLYEITAWIHNYDYYPANKLSEHFSFHLIMSIRQNQI